MPVAVRLIELCATLILVLFVASAGFLMYCARNIITTVIMICQPLLELVLLTLANAQGFFLSSAKALMRFVPFLSGYGTELAEITSKTPPLLNAE